MFKRSCFMMILFAFTLALYCGCRNGKNAEMGEREIEFESLYMGAHPLINNEFYDYIEKKPNAFTEEYTQLICDNASWEIWKQKNYPELDTLSETESLFDVDWETECLMVHTSIQWSETRALQYPVKNILVAEDQLLVEEGETIFVAQSCERRDEDEHLMLHVKYIPYEIVRLSREDVSADILRKYAFSPEYCMLEYENAFISFRNMSSAEKESWFTEGFTLGIIENEADWEKCRADQGIDVGKRNREPLTIDWDTQMLLLYVAKQNESGSFQCHMVEQIFYDDENIYVQENGTMIAMPSHESLPGLYDQPYQLLIIDRDGLPEAVVEKFRIPWVNTGWRGAFANCGKRKFFPIKNRPAVQGGPGIFVR